MTTAVRNKLNLCADDCGILVSGKSQAQIESVLSSELESVSEWLVCNKLSLHLGKTESLPFGSEQKLKTQPALNVTCNGQPIQSKDSIRY